MGSEFANLLQQLRSIDRVSLPDDNDRAQILTAARELCQRLETPFDWVQRITWEEVSQAFDVERSQNYCPRSR